MKKIVIILTILSLLLLTGCNKRTEDIESFLLIQNGEKVDLQKGDLVYIAKTNGSTAVVKLAERTLINNSKSYGIITEKIKPNNKGYMKTNSIINNIDDPVFYGTIKQQNIMN